MSDEPMLGLTSSQTVGPFFAHGLAWPGGAVLTRADTRGQRISIVGQITDGAGAPVPDAFLEVWQANAEGRYDHPDDRQNKPLDPHFAGFGRIPTDADGRFEITTIKPGAVPAPGGGQQAPHLAVGIFARGLLQRLATRIYFGDEPGNAADPILTIVPAARRHTLVARAEGTAYRFDVVLQGDGETVFFDV